MLTNGQLRLDNRMAPLLDVNHIRWVYHRTDILVLLCRLGKTQQTVKARNDVRINLNLGDELLHGKHEIVEELRL